MISRLNRLVYSDDEHLVKQGITLLLNIDLADDTYHNFRQLIEQSNWIDLSSSNNKLKYKLQCSPALHFAFLLCLLKILNLSYHLSNTLIYSSKAPFGLLDELGLLDHYLSYKSYIVEDLNRTQVNEFLKKDLSLIDVCFKRCAFLKGRYYPHLTKASFTEIKWKFITHFLKANPQIECLEIDYCSDYEPFPSLKLDSLKSLSLSRVAWSLVVDILQQCPHIESLHLRDCTLFNTSLKKEIHTLNTLKYTGKNWESFKKVWPNSPHINQLVIAAPISFDLKKVHRQFPSLTYLSIDYFDLQEARHNLNISEAEVDHLNALMDHHGERSNINHEEWLKHYLKTLSFDFGQHTEKVTYLLKKTPVDLNLYRKFAGTKFNLIFCPEGQGLIPNRQLKFKLTTAFYISDAPISRALWKLIMKSSAGLHKFSHKDSYDRSPKDESPVDQISWLDCIEFCNALSEYEGLKPAYQVNKSQHRVQWNRHANGYRLPFEHEWETAFQRSLGMYQFSDHVHYNKIMHEKLSAPMTEWCNNVYAQLSAAPYRFDTGLNSSRAVRSLSKHSDDEYKFERTWYVPSYKSKKIGFRVVRSVFIKVF